MSRLNRDALFDTLMLVKLMETNVGPIYREEIQLLGYLSCMLHLYRASAPVSIWGYNFAGTREGRPFSPDLDDAVNELVRIGFLRESENNKTLKLMDLGRGELEVWNSLTAFQSRVPSLEGAAKSTLSVPIDYIRSALASQSAMRSSAAAGSSRPLLTDSDLEVVYEQFSAISTAVGVKLSELMIPGVIWLKYLTKINEMQQRS